MAWADLNDRGAVLEALAEFELLGREQFLAKYGFGHANRYHLVHEGKEYDAKAIIGAAHGYQFPDQGPLTSDDFSSSVRTVKNKLQGLGFQVRDVKEEDKNLLGADNPTRPRMTVVASSDLKNWEIGKKAGVWGIRSKAKAALAKGRALRPGDRIAVYIAGEGLVAFVEVTSPPEEPWPAGEPDPWQDGNDYQLRIPIRVVQEFSPPVALKFDGAFARSVRIDKLSLLGWGTIDEYQVERIGEMALGEISATENVPLTRAWFFVHVPNSDNYRDKEGQAYHFPLKIPNAKQIDPNDIAICYRTAAGKSPDAKRIFGIGRIKELVDDGEKHRYAVYDKYLRLNEPVGLDEVGGDPRLNWNHSISSFPPDRLKKLLDLAGVSSIEELPDVGPVELEKKTVGSPKVQEQPSRMDMSSIVRSFQKALSASGLTFGSRHELIVRDFLVSLVTKPFVILTGLSGSGKTRIAQHFGDWLGEERSLLAPVRPDWTGAEPLFGYEDALDQEANRAWFVPPILEFMLRAARDEQNPYLLVLDEMNLAHVERYFGDFLSGLESGKRVLPNLFRDASSTVKRQGDVKNARNGSELARAIGVTPRRLRRVLRREFGVSLSQEKLTDALREELVEYFKEADAEEAGRWRMRPGEPTHLPIPRNMFVVGTVNVDETTYMFSPKVLDRANTFEFRVSSEDLDPSVIRPIPTEPAPREALTGLLRLVLDESFHESQPSTFQDELATRLIQLHVLLSEGGYEFGHRVMFESMRFAALNESAGGNLQETLDLQVLQKVLPKLHGSYKRLGSTLQKVAHFTFNPDGSFSPEFDPLDQAESEAFLPMSFEKARRMYRNLKAYQFTSFTD